MKIMHRSLFQIYYNNILINITDNWTNMVVDPRFEDHRDKYSFLVIRNVPMLDFDIVSLITI